MQQTFDPAPYDDGEKYDLILGSFEYGDDFYRDLAVRAGGPVLDVACGTGRLLLPFLQSGIEIHGLDLFEGMLNRLRQKADMLGLSPELYQGDMAAFDLGKSFALIIIPFNAFVHNLSTETQLACLNCCRKHLIPGGQLALDAFFPSLEIVSGSNGERVLELETTNPDTGELIRLYDTRTVDRVHQLQHSLIEIEKYSPEGSYLTTDRSTTSTRWIYPGEMELLLLNSGFTGWKISGDFSGRPIENETDAMIVQAWA